MDLFDHYLQIVFLGIVEGVTEFLPISSTGHLLIAEHLVLGKQEPDIFNVVIQAGAILAVVFIYWHKIVGLVANLDRPDSRGYLLKIFLAFVVTSVLYLGVAHLIGHHKLTESLGNVAWATLIGGFVIFALEYFAKNLYPHEDVSWFESVLIGAAQVVAAIFPGASRSGSTIMAGLAVGMKRPSVTEFSFLVGIPTMFAASVFAVYKGRDDLHGIDHQLILDTIVGFIVSMIVAFFVVKWLLRFVQSHTFNGFGIYRVILGGALLIGLHTGAFSDVSNDEAKAPVPPVPATILAPTTSATTDVSSSTNVEIAPVPPAPAATTNADLPAPPRALPVNPADLTNADATPAAPVNGTYASNGADGISHPIAPEALTSVAINQPVFNTRRVVTHLNLTSGSVHYTGTLIPAATQTNQVVSPTPPSAQNVPAR